MATDYEAFYQKNKQGLGAPTKAFVDFFDVYKKQKARVLDVGCGQGRDALFIARLGHKVVALDHAPTGIADLKELAQKEALDIEARVSDIKAAQYSGIFDVVVLDRVLHMLNAPDREKVLNRLLEHVSHKSHLLIADEPSNLPAIKKILNASVHACDDHQPKPGLLFVRIL